MDRPPQNIVRRELSRVITEKRSINILQDDAERIASDLEELDRLRLEVVQLRANIAARDGTQPE